MTLRPDLFGELHAPPDGGLFWADELHSSPIRPPIADIRPTLAAPIRANHRRPTRRGANGAARTQTQPLAGRR